MKAKTLPPLLLLASLAGCAAEHSDNIPLLISPVQIVDGEVVPRAPQCGLSAIHQTDENGRYRRASSGDRVRACEQITPAAIARACAFEEGEVVYDPDHPYDDEFADFVTPELAVDSASCRFTGDDQTSAICDFTLLREGAFQSVQGQEFAFVFRDLSDGIAHDWFHVTWETRSACVPRTE
ncbi:hypothetical protein [Aurantiacibacter sp. D1-12]|uniref:hypothetical protein n=1 Tax=Aurantiacibacter sp. D1-12 TaxID=2993658 RepID=UPI00237CC236|nr:hypothetical protein [Aurantiacibacter sp. D1-12]MDE1467727.1 hypothetical protein [Aurantiacibacter sp. D1-12]